MNALRHMAIVIVLCLSTVVARSSVASHFVDDPKAVDTFPIDVTSTGSFAGIPPAILLDIPSTYPGGVTQARIAFRSVDENCGFSLLLQIAPGGLVSTSAMDFQRSPAFFPEAKLGDHLLNSARDAGPGRVRIIGLAPVTTTGSTEVGSLRLHISPNAPISATQVVTLTGEINQVGAGIVAIAPVTATVQVIRMDQRIFLPLILRVR